MAELCSRILKAPTTIPRWGPAGVSRRHLCLPLPLQVPLALLDRVVPGAELYVILDPTQLSEAPMGSWAGWSKPPREPCAASTVWTGPLGFLPLSAVEELTRRIFHVRRGISTCPHRCSGEFTGVEGLERQLDEFPILWLSTAFLTNAEWLPPPAPWPSQHDVLRVMDQCGASRERKAVKIPVR